MPIALKSSGGGSVTLNVGSTASDFTLTLPSVTATAVVTPVPAGTASVSPLTFTSGTNLTTAAAGAMEYDGKVPYFTPQGTQRGVVPGMQYYELNSTLAGSNATGAQSTLGVGCTLSASTVYAFDIIFAISKSAGTVSHDIQLLFGGTATLNNINYTFVRSTSTTSFTSVAAYQTLGGYIQTASATSVVSASTSAAIYHTFILKGIVSINAGGTFIPQYQLTVAPGGAYTVAVGAYMDIYPIGASGSNINVGTWA
jgi:hypothetical protein